MKKLIFKLLPVLLAVGLLASLTGCAGNVLDSDQLNSLASQAESLVEEVTDELGTFDEKVSELESDAEEIISSAYEDANDSSADSGSTISEDGEYTSKEEVAAYIHEYGCLPGNYITKSEAQKLGWNSSDGNLWDVAPGKSIGGDKFGNYEGLLPKESGRQYYECDVNYEGGYRGSERIIYSNDGLVYYTNDHYESFEQLY